MGGPGRVSASVGVTGKTLRMRCADPPLVLFLCRLNHAGAIMAEAMLNHFARGRLRATSAGSDPSGQAHPYALECLAAHGIATQALRGKRCGEFIGPSAPAVHFLITLCELESQRCSLQPQSAPPVCAHWGLPDPATVKGSTIDQKLAFEETFTTLHARIKRFLAVPLDLGDHALSLELTRIGEMF